MPHLILSLLLLSSSAIACIEYTLAPATKEPTNTLKLFIRQGKWKEFNEDVEELRKYRTERGTEYPFSAFEALGFDLTMHECAIKVARDLCNPAIKKLVDDLEDQLQAMKEKEEPQPEIDPSEDPTVAQLLVRFCGRIDDFSKLKAEKTKEWQQAGLFDDHRKRALEIVGDKRLFSGKCLPIITITMARFCNQSEAENAAYVESQLSGIAQAQVLLKEIEKGQRK